MKKKASAEKIIDENFENEENPLTNNDVRFYRANKKPYGPFSNLYKRAIIFEGEEYKTSEHAYQAGKARKEEVKKWLMAAPSPALLAMAAHGLYVWDVHPDWSKTKFDRMKRILVCKFTQHKDLQELLLSTGNKRLVEVATVDNAVNRLWGEVNGKGENKLGNLLMEVREEIRQKLEGCSSKSKLIESKLSMTTESMAEV